jgi:hypothetical protein
MSRTHARKLIRARKKASRGGPWHRVWSSVGMRMLAFESLESRRLLTAAIQAVGLGGSSVDPLGIPGIQAGNDATATTNIDSPPSANVATGASSEVEVVNSTLTVISTNNSTGTAPGAQEPGYPESLAAFFQNGLGLSAQPLYLVDPVVTYLPIQFTNSNNQNVSGYFLVGTLDEMYNPTNAHNDFDLALAEDTGGALEFTQFHQYQMNQGGYDALLGPGAGANNAQNNVNYEPDYPRIGWTGNDIVITFMMYQLPLAFNAGETPNNDAALTIEGGNSPSLANYTVTPVCYSPTLVNNGSTVMVNNSPETINENYAHFALSPATMLGVNPGSSASNSIWMVEDDLITNPNTSAGWASTLTTESGLGTTGLTFSGTAGFSSVSREPNVLDVFGVGTDGKVHWGAGTPYDVNGVGTLTLSAPSTQPPALPAGSALSSTSQVTAVVVDSDEIDLFVVATSGALFESNLTISGTGTASSGTFTSWANMNPSGPLFNATATITGVLRAGATTDIDLFGISSSSWSPAPGQAFWGDFATSASPGAATWTQITPSGSGFAA